MRTPRPSPQKKHILLCFSAKDAEGKAELAAHLAPARGALAVWSVDELAGGLSIPVAFGAAAASADVALLLLSSDFFAELDNLAFAVQISELRQQSEERGLLLIPLLWRPCDWQAAPWLAGLCPLPKNGVAIATQGKAQRDQAFAEIAQQLDGRSLLSEAASPVTSLPKLGAWGSAVLVVLAAAIGSSAVRRQRAPEHSAVQPIWDGSDPSHAAVTPLWKVQGIVRDGRLAPLVGVSVTLPEFSVSDVTNDDGYFRLSVPADHEGLALLRAEKRVAPGSRHRYKPHEIHVSLGSTKLDIVLEDSP